MIFVDLGFNVATTLLYQRNNTQLLLFILQDTLIVMSIIALFITFSSTFVFQAGLIGVLLKKFSPAIFISFSYLALSIALHVVSLKDRWDSERRYIWPIYITVLYVLQRTGAAIHYFTYKRTVFFLGDPKYHRDSEWLREKIRNF
ncbi:hypothetical protein AAVH_05252 [Aphelenchoides avenae]|nr:hypothetical protein AAVH_05252 [Aphelenchus avenae]